MAQSKCPKCDRSSFEMKEHKPEKGPKLWFLQCKSCGSVISAFEFFSVNNDLELIKKKLGID
jgi:uncharacterized Zn finger protein